MDSIVQLFSNNLINWLLLMAILAFGWMKLTPAMFASRKEQIEKALKEAELARIEGQEFLKVQTERVANAEAEAEKILEEAKTVAAQMRSDIEAQTRSDEKALQVRISQQITSEWKQAETEMRSRAATVAMRLAEASLPGAITDSSKKRLHNQFLEQLESGGVKK